MPSAMHNLDRESILMLYLAGELSAEDRAEVEQMLANDALLRAQYDEIAIAHEATASAQNGVAGR